MKRLAIIWHSMTGGSKALAEAAASGAANASGVETLLLHADDANPQTLLDANGYIFAFPENLAAISGVMKAFLDRSYYPCLGQIEGRPYALLVCAGSDGSNAVHQAERIATGWRLKRIADSLIVCTHAQTPEEILAPKTISEADLSTAGELGAAMAEGLALGIF
ncbi:MAG: flavodoxin family protein [Sphingorhabdus sp.]